MQIYGTARAAALSLTAILTLGCVQAADDSIAVVNGVPIPQARLDMVLKSQTQQGQQDTPDLRKNIKEVLITREVLVQEAIKEGLDKSPNVVDQLEMAKQEVMIRAYFDDFIKKNEPTDAEAQAEYERVKNEQTDGGNKKEYLARHILIKDEKQAKAALAALNKAKGKNFQQLAKQKSEDQGSKLDGGKLDWSDGSNFVPEFSEALAKLEKGQYTTELVKTKYGYHIILLEDIRVAQFPPYEQVKDRVMQQLLAKKRDAAIEKLRAAAKVE